MRGLRTQEEKKFEKFFEHVQDEAQKRKLFSFWIAVKERHLKIQMLNVKTCVVG